MYRIVIVEDDRYLREELAHTFAKAGYEAAAPESFEAVEAEIDALRPDLLVLDVALPYRSGYELCKSLKKKAAYPILILTARDSLADELTALGLGADDFLTKPCHPDRLLARVARLLQTWGRMRPLRTVGGLSLDADAYKLMYGGHARALAETEGKILQVLMEQFPEVVSKAALLTAVWGTQEFVDENILQVNISRLRKSMAEIGLRHAIRNVRGKGYVLEGEAL